jgi:hypothetical protein
VVSGYSRTVGLDGFGTSGIIRVLTRERWKSSVVIQKSFGGFRKGFRVMAIK